MPSRNPIVVIDDDEDDISFLVSIGQQLKWERIIISYPSGAEFLPDFANDKCVPFLILNDINMPVINGFTLQQDFTTLNSSKCLTIPFVFWSTTLDNKQIQHVYNCGGHGLFIKPSTFEGLTSTLKNIYDCWNLCVLIEKPAERN